MSDFIAQRSKKLAERWAREEHSRPKLPSCTVRLENALNQPNDTFASLMSQRSRQEPTSFKMPYPPMRNHTQTSTQLRPNSLFSQSRTQLSQDTLNSTISQSSMMYILENTRKNFMKCLESHLLEFQNSTIQNEEKALLMYTALNKRVTDAMSSNGSEKNDEGRLAKMFVEIAKDLDTLTKPSNVSEPPTTSSSQHTSDIESESDATEFEPAAFHSTQIDNRFDKPNHKKNVVSNPSSSLSNSSKYSLFQKFFQSKLQNKDRGPGPTTESNFLKNYTSIPTEQLLGQSGTSARLQHETNYEHLSPDLRKFRTARPRSDKNASLINASRIKETLSRKLDYPKSCTPICNWSIKKNENDKIELFGCDSRSSSSKPESHGIVRSRKGNSLIRTTKGVYQLVGPMKQSYGNW